MVHGIGLPKYVIFMCASDVLREELLISDIVERRYWLAIISLHKKARQGIGGSYPERTSARLLRQSRCATPLIGLGPTLEGADSRILACGSLSYPVCCRGGLRRTGLMPALPQRMPATTEVEGTLTS